jgi:hypothetical protein
MDQDKSEHGQDELEGITYPPGPAKVYHEESFESSAYLMLVEF